MANVRQLAPPCFDLHSELAQGDLINCFKSDKPSNLLAQLTPTGSSTSSGATLGHQRNTSLIQSCLGATPSGDEQQNLVKIFRKQRHSFGDDDELNYADHAQKVIF